MRSPRRDQNPIHSIAVTVKNKFKSTQCRFTNHIKVLLSSSVYMKFCLLMFLLWTCSVYVFWTSLSALISEMAKMNNPVAKSDRVFKF